MSNVCFLGLDALPRLPAEPAKEEPARVTYHSMVLEDFAAAFSVIEAECVAAEFCHTAPLLLMTADFHAPPLSLA